MPLGILFSFLFVHLWVLLRLRITSCTYENKRNIINKNTQTKLILSSRNCNFLLLFCIQSTANQHIKKLSPKESLAIKTVSATTKSTGINQKTVKEITKNDTKFVSFLKLLLIITLYVNYNVEMIILKNRYFTHF